MSHVNVGSILNEATPAQVVAHASVVLTHVNDILKITLALVCAEELPRVFFSFSPARVQTGAEIVRKLRNRVVATSVHRLRVK